jgi:hypothetical protein
VDSSGCNLSNINERRAESISDIRFEREEQEANVADEISQRDMDTRQQKVVMNYE